MTQRDTDATVAAARSVRDKVSKRMVSRSAKSGRFVASRSTSARISESSIAEKAAPGRS